MKLGEWLTTSTNQLKQAGIESARLDSLLMAELTLGKNRALLLAHQEEQLPNAVLNKLTHLITRRKNHEPMSYILNKSEFYKREFIITKDTLQPRPETETMIEMALPFLNKQTIVDVGTGSGAIAITLKLEKPTTTVIGTELDSAALKVAKKNAKKYKADVTFYSGDLLLPVRFALAENSMLVCNLPYVPLDYEINLSAKHEPRQAIFGGVDGLDLYRKLFRQINTLQSNKSLKPKYIFTESLLFQHKQLAELSVKSGYKQRNVKGLIQQFERS